MNLSTRLCDLTAGEYVALTQGTSTALSILYIGVGALAMLAFRWWRTRRLAAAEQRRQAAYAAEQNLPPLSKYTDETSWPPCPVCEMRGPCKCQPPTTAPDMTWLAGFEAGIAHAKIAAETEQLMEEQICSRCHAARRFHGTPNSPCVGFRAESGRSPDTIAVPLPTKIKG